LMEVKVQCNKGKKNKGKEEIMRKLRGEKREGKSIPSKKMNG